ncbi:MAG: hypothetical protein OXH50_08330 [Gemmatimonadetes bacterium]|nr:hypothetical protein [Gemmatimonadota bacterium]
MSRHRGPLLRLRACGFATFLFPVVAALAQGAPGPATAVEVSARLDSAAASIGAPLTLTLRLRYPAEYSPLFPRMEEILPRQLAVEAFSPAVNPRPLSAGEVEAVATCRVRAFDLGELTIPPIPIRFAAAGKDTLLRSTAPLIRMTTSCGRSCLRWLSPAGFRSGSSPCSRRWRQWQRPGF